MSSIFCFAQQAGNSSQSTSQQQSDLYDRLKKISEQIKRDGLQLPECMRCLTTVGVAECVISSSYLAFRLEDGRVCRISYTVNVDKLNSKSDKKKSSLRGCGGGETRDGPSAGGSSGGGGGGGGGSGSSGINRSSSYTLCTQRSGRGNVGSGGATAVLTRNSRSLNFLREMQRQGVYLARPLAPTIQASQVPEELIEQCQAVLQGKSRQLIVRELQRTNLDVNMAVNNLLSRDDEGDDGDEWEDETEDLLSLLDHGETNLVFDPDTVLSEDLFSTGSIRGRSHASEIEYSLVTTLNERRKRRRLETATAYQNHIRNSLNDPMYRSTASMNEGSGRNSDRSAGETQSSDLNPTGDESFNGIKLGNKLEFWTSPCTGGERYQPRFVSIASLYSELVGLSEEGEIHQWRWADPEPYAPPMTCLQSQNNSRLEDWPGCESPSPSPPLPPYHPRAAALGLVGEKIDILSGCLTRATVLTASGKLATWLDETLAPMAARLEQVATRVSEVGMERVVSLYTAPLITVARCEHGALYWWGVLPPTLRKKVVEKTRQKSYKSAPSTLSSTSGNTAAHQTSTSTTSSGISVVWRPVGSSTSSRTSGVVSSNNQHAPVTVNANSGSTTNASSNNSSTSQSAPQTTSTTSANTTASTTSSSSSNGGMIIPGAFVCMKNAPIFHAGAIGFTVVDGVPKIGTLLEDAWRLTDVCRFRVKPAAVLAAERRPSPATYLNDPSHSGSSLSSHHCPYATQVPPPQPAHSGSGASFSSSGGGTSSLMYRLLGSSVSSSNELPGDVGRPEMPPPPSPASSTCSDQSGPVKVSPGSFKRKKHTSSSRDRDGDSSNQNQGNGSKRAADWSSNPPAPTMKRAGTPSGLTDREHEVCSPLEEDWCLNDVIFVEDGRTQPVGCVLKVDGNIVAVKFLKDSERGCLAAGCPMVPLSAIIGNAVGALGSSDLVNSFPTGISTTGAPPASAPDPISWLHDCRLLRKEELTVVKNAGSPRVPDFLQRNPKKICLIPAGISDNSVANNASTPDLGILAMAVENSQVHMIVRPINSPSRLDYQVYNLQGKLVQKNKFVTSPSSFMGKSLKNVSLINASERPYLLRDGNGTVYPFLPPIRNGQESLPIPHWLDLPRIRTSELCVATIGRQKVLIGLLVIEDQILMQHVLRGDDKKIKSILEQTIEEDAATQARIVKNILSERCDGQRNILHAAVSMCTPQSNKEVDWNLESVFHDLSTSNSSTTNITSYKIPNSRSSTLHDTFFRRSSYVGLPSPMRQFHILLPGTERNPQYFTTQTTSSSTRPSLSPTERFVTSLSLPPCSQFNSLPQDLSTTGQTRMSDFSNLAGGNNSSTVTGSDYFWHLPPVRLDIRMDEKELRLSSYRIIKMLIESSVLQAHLVSLLSSKNAEGHTPFMQAVSNRVYVVANYLFDTTLELSSLPGRLPAESTCDNSPSQPPPQQQQQRSLLMNMIFPPHSNLDDSPLQMLCYNDTCSFTWTGPDHIRQDIFECRTCGLMDSLCCCTECARVCHKGHDCRLKRTSPTAYCDCWEKCPCHSLVAGNQGPRYDLLLRLINTTDLATYTNKRGEHLLLFLVKTVDRQSREQKQHRPSRRRAHHIRNSIVNVNAGGESGDLEMPEHDLEPPKFSRKALEAVLGNWSAVETMLCTGCKEEIFGGSSLRNWDQDQVHLYYQSGTTYVDQFVFYLLTKCSSDLTDVLVKTLNREMNRPNHADKAGLVAARFVRSVARVYTVLSIEMMPESYRKKSRLSINSLQPLDVCRSVFSNLLPIALTELSQLAAGLIAPVRMGTMRPTGTFSLFTQCSDIINNCEELFLTDPITNKTGNVTQTNSDNTGAANDYDSALSPNVDHAGLASMDDRDNDDRDRADRDDGEPPFMRSSNTRDSTNQDEEDGQSFVEMDTDIEMELEDGVDDEDSDNDDVDMSIIPDSDSDSDSDASNGGNADNDSSVPIRSGQTSNRPDNTDSGTIVSSANDVEPLSPTYPDADPLNAGDAEETDEAGAGTADVETNHRVVGEPADNREAPEVTSGREQPTTDSSSGVDSGRGSTASHTGATSASSNSNSARRSGQSTFRTGGSLLPYRYRTTSNTYSDASDEDIFQNTDEEDVSNESNELNSIDVEDLSTSNFPRSTSLRLSTASRFYPVLFGSSSHSTSQSNTTSVATSVPNAASGDSSTGGHNAPLWMTWAIRGAATSVANNNSGASGTPATSRSGGGGEASSTTGSGATSTASTTGSNSQSGGVTASAGNIALTMNESRLRHQGLSIGGTVVQNILQSSRRNALSALHLQPSIENKECGIQSTQIQLSRAFACLIRVIGDLLVQIRRPGFESEAATNNSSRRTALGSAVLTSGSSASSGCAPLTWSEQLLLCQSLGNTLTPTWLWLCSVMDSVEAQLRFGSGLNKFVGGQGSSSASSAGSGNPAPSSSDSNRQDMLTYLLSVMRSSADEHADALPAIDLSSYKHVAYTLDAFLYLVKSYEAWSGGPGYISSNDQRIPRESVGGARSTNQEEDQYTWPDQEDMEDEQEDGSSLRPTIGSECGDSVADDDTSTNAGPSLALNSGSNINWTRREDSFFRRSESTLSLAGMPLDIVDTPVSLALPLSVKPHLLHPSARREDLFGTARHFPEDLNMQRLRNSKNNHIPIHLGMVSNWANSLTANVMDGSSFLDSISHPGMLMSRWHVTLEMFGRLFAEDVGAEPKSVVLELGGFPVKETRFRKEMERIRNSTRRDLSLEVERERSALIVTTIRQLNLEYTKRHNNGSATPTLSCHRVKVSFRDEPGEGSGVARSFFTAFTEAILSSDKLPNLESVSQSSQSYRYGHQMSRSRRFESLHNITTTSSSTNQNSGPSVSRTTSSAVSTNSGNTTAVLQTLSASSRTSGVPVSRSGGQSSWRRFSGLSSLYPQQLHSAYGIISTSSSTSHTSAQNQISSASTPTSGAAVSQASSIAASLLSGGPIPGGSSGPGAGYWAQKRQHIERLHSLVQRIVPQEQRAMKITSILLELPLTTQLSLLNNDEALRVQIEAARSILNSSESRGESNPVTVSVDSSASSTNILDSMLSTIDPPSNPPPIGFSPSSMLNPRTLISQVSNSSVNLESVLMDEAIATPAPPAYSTINQPENLPLFWQPGLPGYYAPRPVQIKDPAKENARNLAYRTVGRIVGLCLLMNETCPLTLCRHVLKYILSRPLHWHDLAFFDSSMYEGMRHLLACTLAEDGGVSEMSELQLTFVIEQAAVNQDYNYSNCKGSVPLIEGGENIEVTPESVFEYVKRYAEFRMVTMVKEALEHIRKGVFDVIPRHTLDGLTAEDLRLLLNGVGEIDPDVLVSYTTFHDESGAGLANEKVARFKKWFWQTFKSMNHRQRQDLLYFWTSSPALPASEQGFQPMPSITIRPADDIHLPTANTCISRLYIPLYSTKHILKEKILQAIQTKGFGFV